MMLTGTASSKKATTRRSHSSGRDLEITAVPAIGDDPQLFRLPGPGQLLLRASLCRSQLPINEQQLAGDLMRSITEMGLTSRASIPVSRRKKNRTPR